MKSKVLVLVLVFVLLLSVIKGFSQPTIYDSSTTEECRIREGLPDFFKKVHDKKDVRVAYLGGSITHAGGWRIKTLAWFRKQYPDTKFTEIDAAISGTGAGFGACRIGVDVLKYKPDLVFMEFRVNGGEGVEKQSVEGIVRQIRAANKKTDICFVYTISEGMRNDIKAGKNTSFGQVMEEVANYYRLPTIDMGIEVMERETAGTLIFKTSEAKEGLLNFSKDGVHPGDAGHELYTDVITRNILKMDNQSNLGTKHSFKPRLFENPFEQGGMIPIEKCKKSAGWMQVDTLMDSIYTKDKLRTAGMLRGANKCTKAGETIEVKWKGTTLAINDLTQNQPVTISVSIDGNPAITLSRPQNSPNAKYARCKFLPEVKNGKHTAKLNVIEIPVGETYYVGQFLQAGHKK